MPKITTSLLNESIDIERLSGSQYDDRGLSTATWVTNSSNIQARIIRNNNISESRDNSRVADNREFNVIVQGGVDVTTKDRLKIDNEYYEISSVNKIKDRFGNIFYQEIRILSGY